MLTQPEIDELRQYIDDTREDIKIAVYLGNMEIAATLTDAMEKAQDDIIAACD